MCTFFFFQFLFILQCLKVLFLFFSFLSLLLHLIHRLTLFFFVIDWIIQEMTGLCLIAELLARGP